MNMFGCVHARHVVILKAVFVADHRVLAQQGTLKDAHPHFAKFITSGQFGLMVGCLLCEAMNDTRIFAVVGLVNCVVHILSVEIILLCTLAEAKFSGEVFHLARTLAHCQLSILTPSFDVAATEH